MSDTEISFVKIPSTQKFETSASDMPPHEFQTIANALKHQKSKITSFQQLLPSSQAIFTARLEKIIVLTVFLQRVAIYKFRVQLRVPTGEAAFFLQKSFQECVEAADLAGFRRPAKAFGIGQKVDNLRAVELQKWLEAFLNDEVVREAEWFVRWCGEK